MLTMMSRHSRSSLPPVNGRHTQLSDDSISPSLTYVNMSTQMSTSLSQFFSDLALSIESKTAEIGENEGDEAVLYKTAYSSSSLLQPCGHATELLLDKTINGT